MSKTIIVIGGGISGLTTLHYLKQKYGGRDDVRVILLEKSVGLGGTIHSITRRNSLFETGPNGFLDSRPRTLELVRELDLGTEVVKANESAGDRYVALDNTLYAFPTTSARFLSFRPFGWRDKARVFAEIFVPKGNVPNESVYAFGRRRFGKKFADIFLDPLVSGIYAGDAGEVVLKAAFGRIYELEQRYGSLSKAMMNLGKGGMPNGTLTSFRRGQAQLIAELGRRYSKVILSNQEATYVTRAGERFGVETIEDRHDADEVFVSTPAFQAAAILRPLSPSLAQILETIRYTSLAVVGLVFPRKAFRRPPEGFGYLVPSSENKEVLGVLWESNIFPHRCAPEDILMRVMIGGARHPDVLSKSREALTALALKEIQATLKTDALPIETFFVQWPRAIPQYDASYVAAERGLEEELKKSPGLYLVANYRHGVSLNDCIENAYQAAQGSSL